MTVDEAQAIRSRHEDVDQLRNRPTRTSSPPSENDTSVHPRLALSDPDGSLEYETGANDVRPVQSYQESVTQTEKDVPTGPGDEEDTTLSPTWRPFWLRRFTLMSFCFFFLCCTTTLPILLWSSQKYQGLADFHTSSTKSLRTLWRIGPTAVITVASFFWTRVELQTLRYFPWVIVQPGHSFDQGRYTLDYTAMIAPVVLFRSLRKGHYFVFLISFFSFILKALIVLSAGLFYIQNIQVERPIDVELEDSFIINATTDSTVPNYAPLSVARAIRGFEIPYPFGVHKFGAYQTFSANGQPNQRGTPQSPITSHVDGLFMSMECSELESYSVLGTVEARMLNSTMKTEVSFDLKFRHCDNPINVVPIFYNSTTMGSWLLAPLKNLSATFWDHGASLGNTQPCSALPQQHEQFIYFASIPRVPISKDKPLPQFLSTAAVLCSPRTWLSKVQVVDDGLEPNVTVIEERMEEVQTNLWNLLERSIPKRMGRWVDNHGYGSNFGPLFTDFLFQSYGFISRGPNLTDPGIYESAILRRSITNLTEALGPFVAHYHLRKANKTPLLALKSEEIPRLLVNRAISIAMAVLFGVGVLLGGWAMVTSERTFKAWHRDPATLLGSIISFHKIAQSKMPGTDLASKIWAESSHSPTALRTWLRIMFAIYTMALITTLSVMMTLSHDSTGLLAVPDGAHTIWWTSLPALLMLLVGLYTTSSDTAIRDLAILSRLSNRSGSIKELDMSLLDMVGLRALYHSLVLKTYNVTLSQVLAILCGILTTLSTLLFSSDILPQTSNTSFPQTSWLGIPERERDIGFGILDNLLLMQHSPGLKWPNSTYADLVFPTFNEESIPDYQRTSRYPVKLHTRAAKLTPICIQHPVQDFNTSLEIRNNKNSELPDERLYSRISTSQTCPNGTKAPITLYQQNANPSLDRFVSFAGRVERFPCEGQRTVSTYTSWQAYSYIWGRIDSSTLSYSHISYWTCNYTWSEIPTELNLIWQNQRLQIDPAKPPIPDTRRAQPLHPYLGISILPDIMPQIAAGVDAELVEFSYRQLVKPFGPLELKDFGDKAKDRDILDHVAYSFGVSQAQFANANWRLRLDENSTKEPHQPGSLPEITATITDLKQQRLFQSPGITIYIIAVLSLAFLVNLWALISRALIPLCGKRSFFLDLEFNGVAPDSLNSIEMIQRLLDGSNILALFPREADKIPPRTLHEKFAWVRLQIGWFFRRGEEERQYTIGHLQDEDFPYLGPK